MSQWITTLSETKGCLEGRLDEQKAQQILEKIPSRKSVILPVAVSGANILHTSEFQANLDRSACKILHFDPFPLKDSYTHILFELLSITAYY